MELPGDPAVGVRRDGANIMTEPGADPRARGITTDDPSVYLEIGNDLDGVDLRYQCTRAELWAAIEDYRNAPRPYAAEERNRVRALLGLEPEG